MRYIINSFFRKLIMLCGNWSNHIIIYCAVNCSSLCFFLILRDYSRGGCLLSLHLATMPNIYKKKMTKETIREREREERIWINWKEAKLNRKKKKKKHLSPFPHYSHLKNLIIISLNPRQNKPKSNQTLVLLPSNVIMTPILCYMLATRIASIKNNAISKKQIFF